MTYPDTITLARGAHEDRSDGLCLLEAVAWFAGESHSDHPACVSPVVAAYGRHLNDVLPDESRRLLIPFIPAMSHTAGDGLDKARGYLALDWLIRVYTPAWLDLAGLSAEAGQLRGLHRINDLITVRNAGPVVRMAADKATAAGTAARTAAWDAAGIAARTAAGPAAWDAAGIAARAAAEDAAGTAAWDAAEDAAETAAGPAAWDAAGTAAWDAAEDAAGTAAWNAAWDAAEDAAETAAWPAARDAAEDAARDAAWDAARNAARTAARNAARTAARNKLALTVTQLQDSAILLLSTMIHPEMTA